MYKYLYTYTLYTYLFNDIIFNLDSFRKMSVVLVAHSYRSKRHLVILNNSWFDHVII
jgi:hypothetical protein